MKYLTAQDIADELGVSRSRAYEIVRECARVVSGRTIRVSRQAFEAWKKRHEEPPCVNLSIFVEKSGGAASATPTEAAPFRGLHAVATGKRPSSSGATSSDSPSRLPIKPRTVPLSQRPSTTGSPSDEWSAERKGRSTC